MDAATIITLSRVAGSGVVACVALWTLRREPFIALLVVCACAFMAVGHC